MRNLNLILIAVIISYSIYAQNIEKMKEIPHYRNAVNPQGAYAER